MMQTTGQEQGVSRTIHTFARAGEQAAFDGFHFDAEGVIPLTAMSSRKRVVIFPGTVTLRSPFSV